MSRLTLPAIACATLLLAGCDMLGGALGIESPEKVVAAREADGKAIGAACRHAGRAIEDCYVMNKKADKASVFSGWRDMNDYMRENKIEAVAPQQGGPMVGGRTRGASPAAADEANDAAPAAEKHSARSDGVSKAGGGRSGAGQTS